MMTREQPPSSLQRAALSLHSLGAEDRDWILRSLPGTEGGKLRDLLRELQDLGIPAQGVPLHQWIEAGDGAACHGLPSLSPAAMKELAHLLAAEPPRVRNVLLACQPSGWARALPGTCDTGVVTPVPHADRAPALQAAIVCAVGTRLEMIAATPAPGRQGLWGRIAVHFGKADKS